MLLDRHSEATPEQERCYTKIGIVYVDVEEMRREDEAAVQGRLCIMSSMFVRCFLQPLNAFPRYAF